MQRLIIVTAILLLLSAPHSRGQEILENTSFADSPGSFLPWVAHGAIGSVEWQGHTDNQSIHIKNRQHANYGVRQNIMGKINQGQELNVSAWVKLKNGSLSANSKILVLRKDGSGWEWIPLVTQTTNGWSWQNLQGSWVAAWSGTLEHLSICVAGPEQSIEMLIDDVSAIIGGGGANPPASGGQILGNTGMQDSDSHLNPWLTDNAIATLEWQGANGSNKSAYVRSVDSNYHYGFHQDIHGLIGKGQALDIAAWVKLKTGSSHSTSTIYVAVEDGSGASLIPVATTGTNGWSWTEISGTWIADWSGDLLSLSVYVSGPLNNEGMLVDDISASVSGDSNPPASGGQILGNTGMQDSDSHLNPWLTDNAIATLEWQGANGSSKSAYVRSIDGNYHYGLHQDIHGLIGKGQALDIAAWVKLKTGSSHSTSTIYVAVEDGSGASLIPVATTGANGWSWTEISGTWIADWSGDLLSLSVYVSGPLNNEGMLVDDISASVSGPAYGAGGQNPVGNCGASETYTYSRSGMFAYWVGGTQNFRNDTLGRNIDWRETDLGYCFSIDKWLTNGVWHGSVSMDFLPTNNGHLIDAPKPINFNDSLLPFSVAWENTQAVDDYGSHQEFNIRLARRTDARSNRSNTSQKWGYGTKTIQNIPAGTLDLEFEGYFSCGSEGPIKINNTMWIQNAPGPRQSGYGAADRIDIIVHEYDSGLIDWRRMVDPTNQDYITAGLDKRWTVVSPEPARDGMPAVNQGRPALNMDGSDYLIIRRTPGDEGEKCSYNIIRKNVRSPDGNGNIGGVIEFKKLLDYLITHDRINGTAVFNGNWFIPNIDWTVTAQGRYNLKYNETRFGGSGQNIRTIPSRGKWTFTKADLPDMETYP